MSRATDAAYNLVSSYPGGASSLAPRINKAPGTLSGELAARSGYKLGLEDALSLSVLAHDLSILEVFADALDCDVYPRSHHPHHAEPMGCMLELVRLLGELSVPMDKLASRGKTVPPTLNDVKAVESGARALIAQAHMLMASVRYAHEVARGASRHSGSV